MAKPARVAFVASLSVLGAGALGLLVVRPWWQELAPDAAQMPAGLLALALGGAVFLWLRQSPKALGARRRRGRLRDRYPRAQPPPSDDEEA